VNSVRKLIAQIQSSLTSTENNSKNTDTS